jgi:hypothetical protein
MNLHFYNKRLVCLLGIAGLAPFIVLVLACWLVHPDWLGDFIRGQRAYGIAILPFLGGVHWGAALISPDLTRERARRALIWGVVPSLFAWGSTMAGGFGFAVLMLGFFLAYQADKRLYAWYALPDWLLQLRLVLTCGVIAALALTVIAGNIRG